MESPGPRVQLRAALDSGRFVAAPGAYDPFTALIIERAGCDAIYLGGNAMALARGHPQPLLTLDETTDCAMRVAHAVRIPIIVDLGAGFGGAAHVDRAVRRLEAAGAAALHIDDQPYPKRFDYHRPGGIGGIVPIADAVVRLRAAVAARRDANTIVIARTDALRVTKSLEVVIERSRAFADAGVDALMVLDLEPSQACRVRDALPGLPLIWIGGVVPPTPSAAEIARAGFSIAVYPFNTIAGVAAAVTDLWRDFVEMGTVTQDAEMLRAMRGELNHIVDLEEYLRIERGAD